MVAMVVKKSVFCNFFVFDLKVKCTAIKTKVTFQVRCTTDHGEFETQDGDIIVLKKNTQVRTS